MSSPKRFKPWRRCTAMDLVPVRPFTGSIGAALGGTAHAGVDTLECGHVVQAVLLAGRQDRPYRRIGGKRYRRCGQCERVPRDEAWPAKRGPE